MTVTYWDIDRYDEMQDRAWELEAQGVEQDKVARVDQQAPNGDTNRATALGLRDRAATMLTQYWVLPRR